MGVNVNDTIIEKIDALPPLPKTIMDIEAFRQQKNKDLDELLLIINQDALLVSTLLKVANSAIFCFKSKVETVSKAVNLLGVEFTVSIAISSSLQNILKTNLSPYGIHSNDFMRASNISSRLAVMWLKGDLREELVLPAFLQETGKFILAEIIEDAGETTNFQLALHECESTTAAEKKITGMSATRLTAHIFKKWRLNNKMIHVIACVDDLEKCDKRNLKQAQILNVLKTISDIRDPMSEENIKRGLEKATKFGLDVPALKKAISKMEDNLLEEK